MVVLSLTCSLYELSLLKSFVAISACTLLVQRLRLQQLHIADIKQYALLTAQHNYSTLTCIFYTLHSVEIRLKHSSEYGRFVFQCAGEGDGLRRCVVAVALHRTELVLLRH